MQKFPADRKYIALFPHDDPNPEQTERMRNEVRQLIAQSKIKPIVTGTRVPYQCVMEWGKRRSERECVCVCVRVHVRVCECAGVGASARVNADTGVVAQPNRWIRSWRPT